MNPTTTGPAQPVFGSAAAVLELAVSGRWRAPEASTALAEAACSSARAASDRATALLAEGWLIHGLALLGRGSVGAARAVAALGEAEREGRDAAAARLRVGLAAVAREVGDLDSAQALLAPVLGADGHDPVLAADAHIEAVRSGGRSTPDDQLAEADLAAEYVRRLGGEPAALGLAALDAALAQRDRRAGRPRVAAGRAREGLRRLLVDNPAGPGLEPISPHLAARLTEELVLALLDDDQPGAARAAAEPALYWSAAPASVGPLARVRLALAQRVHLPVGERDAALAAVSWAARAGLDDLPELDADCHGLLAEIHEQRGELPGALAASRRAHRSLREHSAVVERTLVLLRRGVTATRSPEVPTSTDRPRPVGGGPAAISATTPLAFVPRVAPDAPAVTWPTASGPADVDELAPERRPGRRTRDQDSHSSSFTGWREGFRSGTPETARHPVEHVTDGPLRGLTDGFTDGLTDGSGVPADGPAHGGADEPSWYQPADLVGDGPREPDGSAVEPFPAEAPDPLEGLFEPGENRPLGLVAVDIATPTGRLTGAPARALLGHVADHVRAQLPPNSRLRLLPDDMIVVVLPPVGADVVARWMRSLSGGLHARWAEYAADTPRSAFRVAVGAFDPEHPVVANVEALCARLDGVTWQAGGGSTDQPSSGRHVAGARRPPDADPRPGGGGGRRRRPETGRGPITTQAGAGRSALPDRDAGAGTADPPSGPGGSSGRPDGVGRASSARLGGVDQAVPGPLGMVDQAQHDGIDRSALARPSALSRLGTMPVPAVGLPGAAGPAAPPDLGATGTGHPGPAADRAAQPAVDGSGVPQPPGGGVVERGRSGDTRSISELTFAELLAGALAAYRDT